MRKIRLLITTMAFLAPMAAQADIIYEVDRTIGAGTVTGFIVTDGTIGSIGFDNFVDYELTLTAPNFLSGSPAVINDEGAQNSYSWNNGVFNDPSAAITATAQDLLFDPTLTGNFIIFWTDNFSHFWCIESTTCAGLAGESIGYGVDVTRAQEQAHSEQFIFASVAASIPEPGTLALVGIGLLGMGLTRRRRNV